MPLKKVTLCNQRPMPPHCVTLRLVLISALCYSPPGGILRLVGFSASRIQLIMTIKKFPLCKQRPMPPHCVTLRLVLLSALCYSPPCVILRYAGFSASRIQLIMPLKKYSLV